MVGSQFKGSRGKIPWGKEARILNHIGENTSKNVTHIRRQNASIKLKTAFKYPQSKPKEYDGSAKGFQ